MQFKRIEQNSPLRRARIRRGWTLVYAAERLGADPPTLSRWERTRTPHLRNALRIVTIFPELALVDLLIDGKEGFV